MFQISLRQLLLLTAAVALAIVSLKYASPLWQAALGLAVMLTLFAALIVAIVDRGPRQVFALGMAVVMLCYGLLIAHGRQQMNQTSVNLELLAFQGQLPTTVLLRYLLESVTHAAYIDRATGKDVPVAEAEIIIADYNTVMQNGSGAGGQPSVMYQQRPAEEIFTPIGHFWWALLLGYLGGLFAQFVYLRRKKDEPAPQAE